MKIKGDPSLAAVFFLFVLLKLIGLFEWSWWWVWCPLFVNVGVTAITVVLTIVAREKRAG